MKKYLSLLLFSVLFLSACGQKTTQKASLPTPTPRLVEMAKEIRPNISLTPRSDGHELTLKFSSISSEISKIEYEITYLATDGNLEIEKGASGLISSKDFINASAERKILLGTESCTSGCKYKYDTGVTGGNMNIIFTTSNGQISTFNTDFILRSSADIRKSGKILWQEKDYRYTPKKGGTNNFYIVYQDYKSGEYLITSNAAL